VILLDFLTEDTSEEDDDDVALPVAAISEENGELTFNTDKLATAADRAEARIKLAQQALLGFNALSDQAHPGGSVSAESAGNLDVKPAVPGAAFHVAKDIKTKMEDFANMPPRVRKQAEMIHKLVSEGSLDASKVDELSKHSIDADAISYYKAMWGEVEGGSEFASKLTAGQSEAKQAEAMSSYKGQVKRAYEFANQMVSKGFIVEAQVDSQVETIMKWNDEAFTSMASLMAKQPIAKQASVPQVGMLDSGQIMLPAAEGQVKTASADIKGVFDSYFDSKGMKF